MKTRRQRLSSMYSTGGLLVSVVLPFCVTQSAFAQQWLAPHAIPVFRGTESQGRAVAARSAQATCLNHIRRLSSALQVYALDHGGQYPTNWQTCASYIGDPAMLVCPASPYQFSGTNWSGFDFSNPSYTLLPATNAGPESLTIICNFHANYALSDGSCYLHKPYASFPAAAAGALYLPDYSINAARRRADATSCLNKLHQIANASRVYALDNADRLPASFSAMESELGSPRLLFCPASGVTGIPTNFVLFDYARASYTMALVTPASAAETPYVTCRYHGSYVQIDGTVKTGPGAYNYPGIIIGNPISQTVDPGATATLKLLTAFPLEALTYQWRRQQPFDSAGEPWTNTVAIAGATNAVLTLTNCGVASQGYYDVVVSLPSGLSETSSMTYLGVEPIVNLPLDLTLAASCCTNNLKQISIAAAMATDGKFPVDSALYSMSLGWPMTLYCPGDILRTPPETWNSINLDAISYAIRNDVAPGSTNILAWCKVHHSYIQADGQIVFPEALRLTGVTTSGGKNILNWTGGVPPYQVQMTTSLTQTNWAVVADSVNENSLPLNNTNSTAFFRVVWQLR